MSNIRNLWDWANEIVAPPGIWLSLIALTAGALVALTPAFWKYTRYLATYVHEAGHATIALMFGRRVTAIRVEADSSGTTDHVGPAGGLGKFLTAFAGYPAPAVAGLGLVMATASGHQRWAVVGGVAIVTILAFAQRSWRGWLLTITLLAAAFLLTQVSQGVLGGILLLVTAGYLLAASPRTVIELHQVRAHGRMSGEEVHSDADSLARQTRIPAVFWEALFLISTGACIYYAIVLLFQMG